MLQKATRLDEGTKRAMVRLGAWMEVVTNGTEDWIFLKGNQQTLVQLGARICGTEGRMAGCKQILVKSAAWLDG